MTKAAAFYDLDKTIIAKSSTLAFRRPFAMAGLIGPKDSLAGAAAQGYYRVAGASGGQLDESKARLSEMIQGWPVAQVEALVSATVEQIIAPYVYLDALKTIRWHRENGRLVVVISASPREWVEPIGYMVGADRVIATQLQVEGGEYTGDVLFYAYGEQKAVAMRALAEAEGIDLAQSWAYSDSYTDVAMLEAVGHPVAVNPDAELRTEAEERDWETVQFMRPPSWDSPLSFLWDAAAALPDVSHATRIALTGWFELMEGAVVATRDATVAMTGLLTGAEDDLPFFPSIQRRSIRGLRPVTTADVQAAFQGPASADPTELVRRAAEKPSQALHGAVESAEESVATATSDMGEKVAQAAEAAAGAVRKTTAKPAAAPTETEDEAGEEAGGQAAATATAAGRKKPPARPRGSSAASGAGTSRRAKTSSTRKGGATATESGAAKSTAAKSTAAKSTRSRSTSATKATGTKKTTKSTKSTTKSTASGTRSRSSRAKPSGSSEGD